MSTLAFNPGFLPARHANGDNRASAGPAHVLIAPLRAPLQEDEIAARDALHPGVLVIMSGCFGIMMLAFWLTFRGSVEARFSVVVSLARADASRGRALSEAFSGLSERAFLTVSFYNH